MKNRMTSDALTTAIAIAMPRLIGAPKSIRVASTVTSVRNSSVPPVAHSTLMVATWANPWCSSAWCSMDAMVASVDEVEEREQEDPDQVDDVPVQRGVVDRSEVFRGEVTGRGSDQQPDEHEHTDEHVDTVQAGHREVDGEEHVRVLGRRARSLDRVLFVRAQLVDRLDRLLA